MLAQRMFLAEKAVATADGLLARGAPVEALRTLSGVRLPRGAGPTADTAFATACKAAIAGFEAEATAREARQDELVEQVADVLDRHVDALLTAVGADAEGRRLRQRSAQCSAEQAVPEQVDPADRPADALPRR